MKLINSFLAKVNKPTKPLSILQWLRRPVKLWNVSEKQYQQSLEQWNREVGIPQKVEINVTRNIFQLKDKKTGDMIDITPEDYEITEEGDNH